MLTQTERRIVPASFRADSQGADMVLVGYAAKYYDGSPRTQSELLPPGFRERLQKNCFDRCLAKNPDVRFLVNHDASKILGRTKNGTLTLRSDAIGLAFRVVLPDTQTARDVYASVQRGDLSQCSFGFTCDPDGGDSWADEWDEETNSKVPVRTVRNVKELLDSSVVTYPAYPATNVSARALWPEGVPVSVRTRVADVEATNSLERSKRRSTTRFVLGL